MNISYRWLQELIPGLSLDAREVADRLAMLGAPVDEVVSIGSPLRDIVIGRVLSFERHPNADRLNLCTVDAGNGYSLQVVCGAPNVREGAFYPFAPVGATLPGDITIRRAKIRGMESQGMLCSARELGLGRDHEGILELHGALEPGASFIDSMALDDARLVVDVTPNRPDLLSHVGVAREIAANQGTPWRLHALPGVQPLDLRIRDGSGGGVTVGIHDHADCPRYLGLVIRGVRVGPSPAWLAGRLRVLGLRPISNVVDATNWVLHELGQPLHAFDLARLGDQVVVRRARAGETITTLDGVERKLADHMLVIADASRPVAVAGVMGGADTEVQDDTTDLLLECALFDPKSVRATRRALGLSTDASYRFERGIDADAMMQALERAAQIIVAVAGGTVERDVATAGPGVGATSPVLLRSSRVEQVLGVSMTHAQVEQHLKPLGFDVASADEGTVHVTVPGHRRHDVTREDDLIEEVARRHGYDNFPDELRPFRPGTVPTHPLFLLEDRVRTALVARGLLEAHTAAFAPDSDGDVGLMLPLAATEGRLRRDLLPGLLRRVEYNFARGARSIRLFELGTAFAASEQALPAESTRLCVALTGLSAPPHWSRQDAAFDVWDLRGLAEELAGMLGLTVEPGGDDSRLDPAMTFTLRYRNEAVGTAGRVRDGVVDAPAWADDVWALELRLDSLAAAPGARRYSALPQHPAVERDLALVVPLDVPAGRVTDVIRDAAGDLLEGVYPFDVFSGKGVREGTRSIAYRLRFRAQDRTLTDAEVETPVRGVLKRLGSELGVEQRA